MFGRSILSAMSTPPKMFRLRNWRRLFGGALVTAALLVWVSALAHAQTARTVQDGVFTNTQAARGAAIYDTQCASCHGSGLKGAQGPPLVGDTFVGNWQTMPLSDLANKIHNTMPASAPGTLTPQQSADIVAHILKTGGFPASATELASSDEALACAATQWFRFAFGRDAGQMIDGDLCAVKSLQTALKEGGALALVRAIPQTAPFLYRKIPQGGL